MAENTAEKAYQLGIEYEKTYTGCSQCVVAALQDAYNMISASYSLSHSGIKMLLIK